MIENGRYYSDEYLCHHGISGMKWGIRRYQNPDGSLTAAGRRRYLGSDGKFTESGLKKYEKDFAKIKKKEDKEKRKASVGKNKTPDRKLTNEELKERIERLQLEKDYKQLLNDVNAKKPKGEFQKTVEKSAAEAGRQLLTPALVFGGKMLAKGIFGEDVYKEMFYSKMGDNSNKGNNSNKGEKSDGSSFFSSFVDSVKDSFNSSVNSKEAKENTERVKKEFESPRWNSFFWETPSYSDDDTYYNVIDTTYKLLPESNAPLLPASRS